MVELSAKQCKYFGRLMFPHALKMSSEVVASKHRIVAVDVIRGLAIAGVVLFHVVWDLEYAGLISGIAFHPIWLAFGRLLAGTFMFLVGVSLVLAHGHHFRLYSFTKRLALVAVSACLITLVTWFAFPKNFIYFGILHAIAVASLIGALVIRVPAYITVCLGVGILITPLLYTSDAFDTRLLAWIGLFETPPPSNDFVPIFPWAGLTLLGISLTKIMSTFVRQPRQMEFLGTGRLVDYLAWLGRNSLAVYLIHQPILLAIILPLSKLIT